MRSAAHSEHCAVLSHDHHHVQYAETSPSKSERLAFWANLHCLAGCAVGAVPGLEIGMVRGWGNLETVVLAVGLAFVFGNVFAMVPLFRGAMAWRSATQVALAADTASIALMQGGFELQAVSAPAAAGSDAVASTNASSTRPAEVSETHPALVELHHSALANAPSG